MAMSSEESVELYHPSMLHDTHGGDCAAESAVIGLQLIWDYDSAHRAESRIHFHACFLHVLHEIDAMNTVLMFAGVTSAAAWSLYNSLCTVTRGIARKAGLESFFAMKGRGQQTLTTTPDSNFKLRPECFGDACTALMRFTFSNRLVGPLWWAYGCVQSGELHSCREMSLSHFIALCKHCIGGVDEAGVCAWRVAASITTTIPLAINMRMLDACHAQHVCTLFVSCARALGIPLVLVAQKHCTIKRIIITCTVEASSACEEEKEDCMAHLRVQAAYKNHCVRFSEDHVCLHGQSLFMKCKHAGHVQLAFGATSFSVIGIALAV